MLSWRGLRANFVFVVDIQRHEMIVGMPWRRGQVTDLILRVVFRTKTVFHCQTGVSQTESVYNVLRVLVDTTII